jgi:uroporphyrinogen-III synthase
LGAAKFFLTAAGHRPNPKSPAGHRLAKHVSALPCADWLMHQPVMTQHPKIAQALRECGWREVREHPPGVSALVHALESLRKPRP